MSEIRTEITVDVHELIGRRWSPRAFDGSKEVSRKQLLSILEAARWAPSCFGDEPWRFVVGDRHKDEEGWQCLLGTLAEKNQTTNIDFLDQNFNFPSRLNLIRVVKFRHFNNALTL